MERIVRVPWGTAALRYERERRLGGDGRDYRDCLFFYCDGRVRFVRYCYGESAGPVFEVWVEQIDKNGAIRYREPFDLAVRAEALPRRLEALADGSLRLDGREDPWTPAGRLARDRENGYGLVKTLLAR